jgi:hypothetical protein
MNHRPLLLALLLAAVVAAQDAARKTYPIKLSRPSKVGLKYRLSVTRSFEQRQIFLVGEEEANREERLLDGSMSGVVTVRRADEKGNERAVTCVVESFSLSVEGRATHPLEKGVSLHIDEKDEQVEVRREDGKAVPDDVRQLLELMFDMTSDSDDDKMFGSTEPRGVGDKWKGNAEAIAADLADKDLQAKPEDIEASVKVTGMTTIAGRGALELGFTIRSKVTIEPEEGWTVEKATIAIDATSACDIDPARTVPAREQGKLVFEMVMKGEGGRFESRVRIEGKDERTPIDE